jgi:hypothetical protein
MRVAIPIRARYKRMVDPECGQSNSEDCNSCQGIAISSALPSGAQVVVEGCGTPHVRTID